MRSDRQCQPFLLNERRVEQSFVSLWTCFREALEKRREVKSLCRIDLVRPCYKADS